MPAIPAPSPVFPPPGGTINPPGGSPVITPGKIIDELLDWLLPNYMYPGDDEKNDSAQEECERQCDLEWDRNRVMCEADAAMRGYDKKRFKQCMDEVDRIYLECYQECAKDCNSDG